MPSSVTASDLPVDCREVPFLAVDRIGRFGRALRTLRVQSISVNIIVASFYGVFLYSSIKFWMQTGSVVGLGLVVFNSLTVGCVLARRRALVVTDSVPNWILASVVQVASLLLRPASPSAWYPVLISSAGQGIALAIMIASLAALNRSIGIVAANRGIKTRGPYSWVRHPMYAGEILFDLSFLVSNWTWRNALLICVFTLTQVVRCRQEETLLLDDDVYVAYGSSVRYRLIPGVF